MSKLSKFSKNIGLELSKYSNKENSEEIIVYMIQVIINNAVWFLVLCFIWVFLYLIQNSVINAGLCAGLILLFYMPLRSRFGGVHAKTFKMCLYLSTIIPVVLGFLLLKINITLPYIIAIYIFSYFTAFKIGVVDNHKRRMIPRMKEKFKNQGIIILTITMFANIILINNTFLSNCISMGVFLAFINLYFEKDIWKNLKVTYLSESK